MKIRPMRAELFPEDRRTDGRDEVHNRSSPFCERAYKPHTSQNTRSRVDGHSSSKNRKIQVYNNIHHITLYVTKTS